LRSIRKQEEINRPWQTAEAALAKLSRSAAFELNSIRRSLSVSEHQLYGAQRLTERAVRL
jgi:hypothetical protein